MSKNCLIPALIISFTFSLVFSGCSSKKEKADAAGSSAAPDGSVITSTFGGDKIDFMNDILVLPDGGFLVAGNRSSVYRQDTTDIWLFKFDSSLNKVWDKIIGAERAEEATALRQLANGNIIMVGRTESKGQGWSDIWLMEMDTAGTPLWDTTYGWGKYEDPGDIIFTPESTLLMVGTSQWEGVGDNDMWVLNMDRRGHVIWSRNYGDSAYEKGWAIEPTNDGAYLIAGSTTSKGAGDYDGWLVKIDPKGNVLWDKTVGTPTWQELYAVRKTPEGGFLAAGSTVPQGRQDRDAWLVRLDENGNTLWERELGEYQEGAKENYFDAIFSIEGLENGNFILCGASIAARPYLESYAWLQEIDRFGMIKWQSKFQIGKNGWFSGKTVVRRLKGGGHILGSSKFVDQKSMWDMWLCRLDKKGKRQ